MFGRKKEKKEDVEKKDEIEIKEEPKQNLEISGSGNSLIPEAEIPEKQIPEFQDKVTKMPQKILDYQKANTGNENWFFPKVPIMYQEEDRAVSKYANLDDTVNFWLPVKMQNEEILWYRTRHEGVLNKKLAFFEAVTNLRIYSWILSQQAFGSPVLLSSDNDVIVTNQKRYSTSDRQGSFAGLGTRGTFVGSTVGSSASESQTIGDVNIMFEGQIYDTLFQVEDPHGLASLIKNVIKHHAELEKKLGEQEKGEKKEIDDKEKNLFECKKCGTKNPAKSKFCNKCGSKLVLSCAKCGADNSDDSSFCNKCGFALK